MDDSSMVKIMQSLDIDYSRAVLSTKSFEKSIESLNMQLQGMKGIAIQTAKDINATFSSQLGITNNNQIVNQFGVPFKTIKSESVKVGSDIANSFKPATQAAKVHGETIQEVAKKYDVFGSEVKRRADWFISGGLFFGALKGAKEAVQTISEVEMGMVEIARVMEDSTFRFKDYRDELLQMGVDYGQSFENVQQIALRWAQSGYNVADSLELTNTSLLALNTAELDAKNATESMIGIMAQWNLQAEDLALVMDKINLTADNYSVTSQDLVDGLLRSSGAARIMNLSLDETISLLTVMREASGRTGKEVGSALNSILSYIQRPKSIDMLESMGISMFADTAKTQFRNVMEIFQDIASQWGTASDVIKDGFIQSADEAGLFNEELATALGLQEEWNDLQQRDIAQASAGVYRRNYFIGMIERLSNTQGVLNGMMDASGYSIAENERTMDTLEKKYQSLKTSAEQLAVALGDAGLLDALKGIVDTGTDVVGWLTSMDDEAKALLTTALELIAVIGAIKGISGLFTTKNLLFGSAEAAALLPGWTKLLAIIPGVIGALALYANNLNSASSSAEDFNNRQKKITENYESQTKAADESITNMEAEAAIAETLARKLETLNEKESLNITEKEQLKTIVDKLNASFPDLTLAIDEQTGKVIGNTSAVYDNIAALKEQVIQQARAAKMQAIATAYVEQEILVGDLKTAELEQKTRTELLKSEYDPNNVISSNYNPNNYRMGNFDTNPNRLPTMMNEKEKEIFQAENDLRNISNQLKDGENRLNNLKNELDEYGEKVMEASGNISEGNKYVPSVGEAKPPKSKTKAYKNEALDEALKVLDYRRYINDLTLEDEIEMLYKIRSEHVNNADELMDINKRIYSAEKSLVDKRLQNSVDWINKKKNLDELSTEEEIAAWERVLKAQSNNIKAVEEATLNLHKLRKKLSNETYQAEETNIQHLTKVGIYNIQEQIDAYRKLYSVKTDSIEDEQKRIENLFNLYKQLLSEEQKKIKDAYDERIDLIDEEAKRKKQNLEDEKKAIQEQLDLLDRKDNQRSYEQTMTGLQEELKYWQVRTSEEARKKVIEIQEQIDEEKYKHELEKQKQSLQDKIDVLDDEIDEVERTAEEEKKKWQQSYKQIEKAFDTHSTNIVALAGSMSKEAYQQWVNNYLIPLQSALSSGNFDSFDSLTGGLNGSINDLGNNTNTQIYQAAKTILNLKKQWTDGDTSASKKATQYYNQLKGLGNSGQSVADFLNKANYEIAKKYVNSLPKFHNGGKALTDGLAIVKKQEMVLTPDLSLKMEGLLNFLKGNTTFNKNSTSYDNRKDVKIDRLVNIERNIMEDEVDSNSFAREINRLVKSII